MSSNDMGNKAYNTDETDVNGNIVRSAQNRRGRRPNSVENQGNNGRGRNGNEGMFESNTGTLGSRNATPFGFKSGAKNGSPFEFRSGSRNTSPEFKPSIGTLRAGIDNPNEPGGTNALYGRTEKIKTESPQPGPSGFSIFANQWRYAPGIAYPTVRYPIPYQIGSAFQPYRKISPVGPDPGAYGFNPISNEPVGQSGGANRNNRRSESVNRPQKHENGFGKEMESDTTIIDSTTDKKGKMKKGKLQRKKKENKDEETNKGDQIVKKAEDTDEDSTDDDNIAYKISISIYNSR
ncbi:hypothetical protein HNY73_006119 [Argiope bruennichi]|uniref:Uncharacterized protein n=1 Tax=Argiope bruennichi TaxID=94029 RepID=A0A8T0FNN9_ARGBR|nr:hypothetical protein HNY73_006119 [Argiope bruennichi]